MICQSKFAGKLAKILKKPNFQYRYIDTIILVYCCTKRKLYQITALPRQKLEVQENFRDIQYFFYIFLQFFQLGSIMSLCKITANTYLHNFRRRFT